MIIDRFEQAALKAGDRRSLMITATAPLMAMESVLDSAGLALVESRPPPGIPPGPTPPPAEGPPGAAEPNFGVDVSDEDDNGLPEIRLRGSIEFEADLTDVFGDDLGGRMNEYMQECLNCDARIEFDWQLQPIDLLGPIAQLLREINLAVDSFQRQMDPVPALQNFCRMLNGLNPFCIPDLITILMALRMLMQKYLTFALDIKLDWTVVLGPILKVIVDGINSFVRNIGRIILAPLDCSLGALGTAERLQNELDALISTAVGVGERIGDRAEQIGGTVTSFREGEPAIEPMDNELIDAHINWRDVTGDDETGLPIQTRDRRQNDEQREGSDFTFPTGFRFSDKVSLPDAVRDPDFLKANWMTQLRVAVADAKRWIKEMMNKITNAFNSLQKLTTGGLGVQLGNLGLLLFLRDMVAVVGSIITMLRNNRGITDWCEYIQDNPEALRPLLRNLDVPELDLIRREDTIVLLDAGQEIGIINTCANRTYSSTPQSALLADWIARLQDEGIS